MTRTFRNKSTANSKTSLLIPPRSSSIRYTESQLCTAGFEGQEPERSFNRRFVNSMNSPLRSHGHELKFGQQELTEYWIVLDHRKVSHAFHDHQTRSGNGF